jgi:hypothetical protein
MNRVNRRSFISTAATSVAALATLGTACRETQAQLVYTKSDWKLSKFNLLAKSPAPVKQLYDIIHIADGSFLNDIKNSLNGLHFGFGIPEEQIKIVAALHGPANQLNYDDFIWNKYQIGAWLKVTDPSTGQNKPTLAKGQNEAGGRVAGREWRRGVCQTGFGFVWRDTGALTRVPARAAAERRPPGRGGVG